MQVLCSTGAVTHYPTRADHRLVADVRELPADGFELSIYTNWIDGDETVGDDLALGIETIPCSVGSLYVTRGRRPARAVERDPRCVAVLDTEFLALHGELEHAPDAGLPVGHVHLKDFAGAIRRGDPRTRYLLPGEGSLDLDGFLARLRRHGYEGAVTLEASAVDGGGELDRARLAEIAGTLRRLRA